MKGSLQIKNDVYQAVFSYKDDNGKKKTLWRSTGVPATKGNKHKAEERMAEILEELERKPPSKGIAFVDYIDFWLENAKSNIDVITYYSYKSYVENHIKPFFAELKVDLQDVTLFDIERYYQTKAVGGRKDGKAGGLSYSSLKRHRVVLTQMFNEAVRTSLVKDNPCRLARIPKNAVKTQKITSFYNVDQCKALLDASKGTPLYEMVYLTFLYGLRRSELMGLKWDAIDFSLGTLTIQHTVVLQKVVVAKDTTKNKTSNRTYPLLDDIRPLLLNLWKRKEEFKKAFGKCYIETGYVFVKENGESYYPSYPTHALDKILKQHSELPRIRWHDLRHSCASILIDKGWPMKDISDWLGHADIGTTMNIYGHLDMAHKRNMAQSLGGLLG